MKKIYIYLSFLIISIFINSCATMGGSSMSLDELLAAAGVESLPTQEDYPEYGGVVLSEFKETKLFLDSDWDLNFERSYHSALLYFNDKAENRLTESIYLDPDMKLLEFSARTIKPNGEIIELTEKDLHPAKLSESFVEFTDEESVKFTFPGVEKGAILEYSYKVAHFDRCFSGDYWNVQKSVPVLYTRYTIDIPTVVLQHGINWNYASHNVTMPEPVPVNSLMNKKGLKKDRSIRQYWELRDIPAIESEPGCPPYRDVARYVEFDVQYEDWDELTGLYWKYIDKYFSRESAAAVRTLAYEIAGDAETEKEKIRRVFDYTQKDYRYVAITIDDGGYIPHDVQQIVTNKYGDCKDMTVLNVNLLRALDIEAYPALVRTKSSMYGNTNVMNLNFNHMVALAITEDGEEYWLDATGSNCPLGEVYSSIEGKNALVIDNDGKHRIATIPPSKSYQNKLTRDIDIVINNDGSLEGKAKVVLTGEENLGIRSVLKDASENDMKKIVKSYANSNLPDLEISNLEYDDPSAIIDTFTFRFDFRKEKFGTVTKDMIIINPYIFDMSAELDKYRDEERKLPLVHDYPFRRRDDIRITYDPAFFEVSSRLKPLNERNLAGSFWRMDKPTDKGELIFARQYSLEDTYIQPTSYGKFRDIHKVMASANSENIVLTKTGEK